jgi:hypothetical protein
MASENKSATASETPQTIRADLHSADIWSTARALNVLREESYNFGGSPVICKTLEDAARYLGEFGEIRSNEEFKRRWSNHNQLTARLNDVLNSDAYREGERVIAKRQADKLRTETRKTSKKAVKRG